MRLWLIGLLLFSGAVSAKSDLYALLATNQYTVPETLMSQLEAQHPGVISQFKVSKEQGKLVYHFRLLDAQAEQTTEYKYRADNGVLLKVSKNGLHSHNDTNKEQLVGAKAIQAAKETFSELVKVASQHNPGYLISAETDHDLGVNFIQLDFMGKNGIRKVALNINNQQLLPLLKWD